ncbi:MAG: hypothetical protein KIA12_05470 [Varibaculum cambriense]|uniref:hypothetical protein n=1 Tax=Varibaculum cambriense TaxID=184870 RepID=UPI00241F7BB7|nr:hypothetical protein [Varibaculum cambriense]MBS5972926.1 hypothetical protein [Varibaculum cambriense]
MNISLLIALLTLLFSFLTFAFTVISRFGELPDIEVERLAENVCTVTIRWKHRGWLTNVAIQLHKKAKPESSAAIIGHQTCLKSPPIQHAIPHDMILVRYTRIFWRLPLYRRRLVVFLPTGQTYPHNYIHKRRKPEGIEWLTDSTL